MSHKPSMTFPALSCIILTGNLGYGFTHREEGVAHPQ